jgi:hypothetical protein
MYNMVIKLKLREWLIMWKNVMKKITHCKGIKMKKYVGMQNGLEIKSWNILSEEVVYLDHKAKMLYSVVFDIKILQDLVFIMLRNLLGIASELPLFLNWINLVNYMIVIDLLLLRFNSNLNCTSDKSIQFSTAGGKTEEETM